MKNEMKIRKMLGNNYHLTVNYNGNMEIEYWALYKKYNDTKIYFSKDNEALMSSEKNTEEELLEFVKKHRKINIPLEFSKIALIIEIIIAIIVIVNGFFIQNKSLNTVLVGLNLGIVLSNTIIYRMSSYNFKIDMLEHRERFEKSMEDILETIKENEKK